MIARSCRLSALRPPLLAVSQSDRQRNTIAKPQGEAATPAAIAFVVLPRPTKKAAGPEIRPPSPESGPVALPPFTRLKQPRLVC